MWETYPWETSIRLIAMTFENDIRGSAESLTGCDATRRGSKRLPRTAVPINWLLKSRKSDKGILVGLNMKINHPKTARRATVPSKIGLRATDKCRHGSFMLIRSSDAVRSNLTTIALLNYSRILMRAYTRATFVRVECQKSTNASVEESSLILRSIRGMTFME